MTKLFLLAPSKLLDLGTLGGEEKKSMRWEPFGTAFVAAYESSRSVSRPNELVCLV